MIEISIMHFVDKVFRANAKVELQFLMFEGITGWRSVKKMIPHVLRHAGSFAVI
jgi:hypothetical protein